jgi:hypothetical protein
MLFTILSGLGLWTLVLEERLDKVKNRRPKAKDHPARKANSLSYNCDIFSANDLIINLSPIKPLAG